MAYALIAIGIGLRVVRFAVRRSLWGDEAKLALNIVNRTYPELLQVLDYDQVAPVGFLWLEKAITQILGPTEVALRLVPLLAGIATLFLAYRLSRRVLTPLAMPIALGFVALSSRLIYYSAEVKPYAVDVALTLAVLAYGTFPPKLTPAQALRVALLGAIAIWFSYPAVLVLAGVGLLNLGQAALAWWRNQTVRWGLMLLAMAPWAISFAGVYVLSVSGSASDDTLLGSWSNRRGFPATLPDLDWLFYALKRMFVKPLEFPEPLFNHLAIAAWLLGGVAYFRQRRPFALALLLSPLAMSLVAAYLYRYPFYSRLIVFLVPPMVMIMAEGIAALLRWRHLGRALGVALLLSLLYLPARASARILVDPPVVEDIRPLLAYVAQQRQPEELLYVFQKSKFQFQFYNDIYGYNLENYVIGVDADELGVRDRPGVRRLYRQEFRKLCRQQNPASNIASRRLWVLVADINIRRDTELMLEELSQIGTLTARQEAGGASSFVERYELTGCRPAN